MKIIDIVGMPNYNPKVKDGVRSVSEGKVILGYSWHPRGWKIFFPCCLKHGAMNKVSKDGIWRCLMCGVGCYEPKYPSYFINCPICGGRLGGMSWSCDDEKTNSCGGTAKWHCERGHETPEIPYGVGSYP